MRLFSRLALIFGLLLVAHVARAADVHASADATKVGVGDRIQLHLIARSTSSMPTDPELLANSMIFDASAPSMMPTQSFTYSNGVGSSQVSLNVDWTLRAKQLGQATFTPRVKIDGKVVQANAVTITVVPAGQAPPPPSRQPTNPFSNSPFGGPTPFGAFDPFSFFNGTSPDDQPLHSLEPVVPLEPKLALSAPRDPIAFLHAMIDKNSAVVGEQVTYSVYVYFDQREPDFNDVHEGSAADFIKQTLIDTSKETPLQYANVGGRVWAAKLIQKWALFPIKTGNLEIGPMRIGVVGSRKSDMARASESLVVRVDEPPISGRPPGFVSGNVGAFKLEANVAPREVDRGGAVAVDVELSGIGNLPSNITPPPQQGVDWLVPEVRDDVASKNGKFGGSRRFSYVVHMNRAGDVDLGDIAIPFFDPDKHAYDVARAPLGIIHVKPNGREDAVAEKHDDDPLPNLPALEPGFSNEAPRKHLADRPIFWLCLLFSPLAFFVAAGGRSASQRIRTALESRSASPTSLLARRISEAKRVASGADARAADAAIAKMIEHGVIVRADINVRALTIDEVEDHLVVRGVDRDTAQEIADLLRGCEEARFLPEAGSIEVSRERLERAIVAIDALDDHRKRKERV